jgi:hypothetical protein
VAYSEISSQLIPRQRQMQFSCQIDVVKIQTSPLPIWPNVEFPDAYSDCRECNSVRRFLN